MANAWRLVRLTFVINGWLSFGILDLDQEASATIYEGTRREYRKMGKASLNWITVTQ